MGQLSAVDVHPHYIGRTDGANGPARIPRCHHWGFNTSLLVLLDSKLLDNAGRLRADLQSLLKQSRPLNPQGWDLLYHQPRDHSVLNTKLLHAGPDAAHDTRWMRHDIHGIHQ